MAEARGWSQLTTTSWRRSDGRTRPLSKRTATTVKIVVGGRARCWSPPVHDVVLPLRGGAHPPRQGAALIEYRRGLNGGAAAGAVLDRGGALLPLRRCLNGASGERGAEGGDAPRVPEQTGGGWGGGTVFRDLEAPRGEGRKGKTGKGCRGEAGGGKPFPVWPTMGTALLFFPSASAGNAALDRCARIDLRESWSARP